MITRQAIEGKLKGLRRQHVVTDYDLGQIAALNWIMEDWDWEKIQSGFRQQPEPLPTQSTTPSELPTLPVKKTPI